MKTKVLLTLEDEPRTIAYIKQLLAPLGIKVRDVASPEAFLDAAQRLSNPNRNTNEVLVGLVIDNYMQRARKLPGLSGRQNHVKPKRYGWSLLRTSIAEKLKAGLIASVPIFLLTISPLQEIADDVMNKVLPFEVYLCYKEGVNSRDLVPGFVSFAEALERSCVAKKEFDRDFEYSKSVLCRALDQIALRWNLSGSDVGFMLGLKLSKDVPLEEVLEKLRATDFYSPVRLADMVVEVAGVLEKRFGDQPAAQKQFIERYFIEGRSLFEMMKSGSEQEISHVFHSIQL